MKITRKQLTRLIKEHMGDGEELSDEMEDKLVTAFFKNGPHGLMLAQSLGAEEWVEDFEYILSKAQQMIDLSQKLVPPYPGKPVPPDRMMYLNIRDGFRIMAHSIMRSLGISEYQQHKAATDLDHPFHDVVSAYLEFAQNAQYTFTDYGMSVSNVQARAWFEDWITGY